MRTLRREQYEALHAAGWTSRGHLWYHATAGWGLTAVKAIIATAKHQPLNPRFVAAVNRAGEIEHERRGR